GVDGDVAAEQRLDRSAEIADDAARPHRDAADDAEMPYDPVAGKVVGGCDDHGGSLPKRDFRCCTRERSSETLQTSQSSSRPIARSDHSMMLATTPAPTVRPPSRMAKRSFSSMAIGTISSILIAMLSPGITISVPSGRWTTPVTSVVRK